MENENVYPLPTKKQTWAEERFNPPHEANAQCNATNH